MTTRKDKETGILYRSWLAAKPEAVLLLVHGLGAHSARWQDLSDFLLQKGISSYAIELKGFGETEGPEGHVDSFGVYLKDIDRLRDIVIGENKGKKVILLGESMGALISFLAVAARPDLFGGLICISPAFVNKLKLSIFEYAKIFSSLVYNPRKKFHLPFTPEMCTRDMACQKQVEEDPMEHRSASARLIYELIASQVRARIVKEKVKIPVLFLLAGEDKLVDSRASERIFKSLEVRDKTLIEYPGMYHALSIDLGREKVFRDIADWIQKREA